MSCDDVFMIMNWVRVEAFQMILPFSDLTVTSVDVLYEDGTLDSLAYAIAPVKYRLTNSDTFVFTSVNFTPTGDSCGCRRVRVTMSDATYRYSNRFLSQDFQLDQSPYLYIEYWNDCDMDPYIFRDQWRGGYYVDAELLQPKYEEVVETKTDEKDKTSPIKKTIKKRREFNYIFAEEHDTDTLCMIIPAVDNVIIHTPSLVDDVQVVSEAIEVTEIDVSELEWTKCYAEGIFRFTAGCVTNTGCCHPLCEEIDHEIVDFVDPADQATVEGTASVGEKYYITPTALTGTGSFYDNHNSIATYLGGAEWDFEYQPPRTVLLQGGLLYTTQVIDGEVHPICSFMYDGITLTGYIPTNSAALVSPTTGSPWFPFYLTSEELLRGVEVADYGIVVNITIDVADVNSCGNYDVGSFPIIIV